MFGFQTLSGSDAAMAHYCSSWPTACSAVIQMHAWYIALVFDSHGFLWMSLTILALAIVFAIFEAKRSRMKRNAEQLPKEETDQEADEDSMEDSLADDSQSDDPQVQESLSDNPQTEDLQPVNPRAENSQPDNSQTEDSQPDNSQTEDSQPDNSQTEDSQPDNSQTEDSQPDNSQAEDSQAEDSQPDNPQSVDPQSVDPQANKQDQDLAPDNNLLQGMCDMPQRLVLSHKACSISMLSSKTFRDSATDSSSLQIWRSASTQTKPAKKARLGGGAAAAGYKLAAKPLASQSKLKKWSHSDHDVPNEEFCNFYRECPNDLCNEFPRRVMPDPIELTVHCKKLPMWRH